MSKCENKKCLKQVNPAIPDLFFGKPFEYDERWFGCYLCIHAEEFNEAEGEEDEASD